MNRDLENMSERSRSPKAMCCLIPFIQNIQNRQTHRDRKQVGGWLPGAGGSQEGLLNGHRDSFWGDETILELERGGGCITL